MVTLVKQTPRVAAEGSRTPSGPGHFRFLNVPVRGVLASGSGVSGAGVPGSPGSAVGIRPSSGAHPFRQRTFTFSSQSHQVHWKVKVRRVPDPQLSWQRGTGSVFGGSTGICPVKNIGPKCRCHVPWAPRPARWRCPRDSGPISGPPTSTGDGPRPFTFRKVLG